MKLPLSPSLSPPLSVCLQLTALSLPSLSLSRTPARALFAVTLRSLLAVARSFFASLSLRLLMFHFPLSLSLHKVVCFEIAFLVVVVVFVCQSVSLTRRTRRRRRQRRQQRAPARKVNKVRCSQMQLCVCVPVCVRVHVYACMCMHLCVTCRNLNSKMSQHICC